MNGVLVVGVLTFAALGGLAFGALTLARPALVGGLLGLKLDGPSGHNEVRSQYGGFFLLLGLLAASALAGWTPATWTLVMLIVTFGGLTAGRFLSLALDWRAGRYNPTIRALCVFDACMALSSAAALSTQLR